MSRAIFIGVDPDASGGYLCVLGVAREFHEATNYAFIDRTQDFEHGAGKVGRVVRLSAAFHSTPVDVDGAYSRSGIVRLVQRIAWAAAPERGNARVFVALEKQQAFPGKGPRCPRCGKPKHQQGLASTAANVAVFECWATAFESVGITEVGGGGLFLPRPADWKGPLGLSSDKELSVKKARELAPGLEFRPWERNPRARAASHGKAEALLLAFHARRVAAGSAR